MKLVNFLKASNQQKMTLVGVMDIMEVTLKSKMSSFYWKEENTRIISTLMLLLLLQVNYLVADLINLLSQIPIVSMLAN